MLVLRWEYPYGILTKNLFFTKSQIFRLKDQN